jgi:hypothetical protein
MKKRVPHPCLLVPFEETGWEAEPTLSVLSVTSVVKDS